MAVFILSPVGIASADPPINTNPNDACAPADHPAPEQYGSGIDGMVKPPNYPSDQLKKTAKDAPDQLTYYDRYGTRGQSWHAVDMGCSDMPAMIGNNIANTVFVFAQAIDRTTITIYQAAASESLLGWLKKTVDGVIRGMGNTFGAKYWSWVVILGALWLAWWGLIRRRASRVAEGTIWMVLAMVALIWLIGRPGDFTTLGTKVSNGATAAFNAALPQSDADSTTCIPRKQDGKPPQPVTNDAVTRNANGLWVTLVCKPWLMGEFGTDDPKAKIVQDNAATLLASQAVDLSESTSGQKVDLGKKADTYKGVTKNIKDNYPGAYSLFQGKDWQSRLAVGFGALLAALVAGLLVLIVSVMLIILKISFLLLLVAGPIFLGIGIHPGIGRVIAVRWFELLLSTLLKQAALIGVLALLLWCYGLVMAESLPWGLQILLISLVTLAAFVYRKPFQHLFAAVGYSAVGSRKGEQEVDMAVRETRKRTTAIATAAIPGAAGYRLGRWGGKRDSGALAGAPTLRGDDAADFETAGREVVGASDRRGRAAQLAAKAAGAARGSAPPLNLSPRAQAAAPAARANGGGLWSPRPSGSGGTARPPAPRVPLDAPSREEHRPSASGGGARPPSAPTGPSWGAGGKTSEGQGSGTRTPPRRPAGGGESGGRGRTGGGEKGGAATGGGSGGGSGGGRSWFGGGSGGRTTPRPDASGSKKSPAARGGASGARPDPASPARRREETRSEGKAPPPLWSDKSRQDGPAMPFWLRPAKREESDEQ
ncbi:type IV secretion system protein [Actinoallomurus rhizosphaericola]|uniref:type IV secretion system protein n=1 Tax=Actinoallomurus rhizosphaericola TaxID=2952536 RepID=UPI003872B58E|nr:type IV secretion system protein [Actinoallomurus rhizosphaericola]